MAVVLNYALIIGGFAGFMYFSPSDGEKHTTRGKAKHTLSLLCGGVGLLSAFGVGLSPSSDIYR